MEQLSRTREDIAGVRNIPGALPVLGRAYLAEELRRIALTSGSLLALIIVLWLVLR
jgi:hypothetical protein